MTEQPSGLPYRPNVGIAMFNAQGLVFAGRGRAAGPEIVEPGFDWQMPQGGIDPDEDIVAAARRELTEETGASAVSLLSVTQDWWGL
jgi:putative (di)nucleoside polyphosphate hydrolase